MNLLMLFSLTVLFSIVIFITYDSVYAEHETGDLCSYQGNLGNTGPNGCHARITNNVLNYGNHFKNHSIIS